MSSQHSSTSTRTIINRSRTSQDRSTSTSTSRSSQSDRSNRNNRSNRSNRNYRISAIPNLNDEKGIIKLELTNKNKEELTNKRKKSTSENKEKSTSDKEEGSSDNIEEIEEIEEVEEAAKILLLMKNDPRKKQKKKGGNQNNIKWDFKLWKKGDKLDFDLYNTENNEESCSKKTIVNKDNKLEEDTIVVYKTSTNIGTDRQWIYAYTFNNGGCINWYIMKIKENKELENVATNEKFPENAKKYLVKLINEHFNIFSAIETENVILVKHLLENEYISIINEDNIIGVYPLELAIEKYIENNTDNSLKIVKLLLNHKDIKIHIMKDGVDIVSLFILAIVKNNINIMKLLLKHNKFDINTISGLNGNTALHQSIEQNNIPILKLLLKYIKDKNIDINSIKNIYGYTPLELAIKDNNDVAVSIILENKELDINFKTFEGNRHILDMAIDLQNEYIIEQILNHPKFDINVLNDINLQDIADEDIIELIEQKLKVKK